MPKIMMLAFPSELAIGQNDRLLMKFTTDSIDRCDTGVIKSSNLRLFKLCRIRTIPVEVIVSSWQQIWTSRQKLGENTRNLKFFSSLQLFSPDSSNIILGNCSVSLDGNAWLILFSSDDLSRSSTFRKSKAIYYAC